MYKRQALNLPGIILASLLYTALIKYKEIFYVKKLINGLKYGAMALLGSVLYDMVRTHFGKDKSPKPALLALAFFFGMEFFDLPIVQGLFAFLVIYMLLPLPLSSEDVNASRKENYFKDDKNA